MKRKSIKVLGVILAIAMCASSLGVVAYAQEEPATNGIIGLTFGEVKSVISGQTATGRVFTYDVAGSDAFSVTFQYDVMAFAGLDVEAGSGVTILASKEDDGLVGVVFIVDPSTADYSNLLKVTVTGGPDETEGAVSIVSAEAARQGGLVLFTIDSNVSKLTVVNDGLVDDFNIQTLSKAMTFYLLDRSSPNWAAASRYDMNEDGVIDLQDFIKIANIILDNQRISKLRFSEDGKFKIMQVTDVQDYLRFSAGRTQLDQRTVALLTALVEAESPDMIVVTGDNVGSNMNEAEFTEYIRQFAEMFDAQKIPWMITYGNHDEDASTALAEGGWDCIKQLAYFRGYEYNINRASMGNPGVRPNGRTYAVGDMYQLIYDNEGKNPIYNVWALDSNRPIDTFSRAIGGDGYDWVKPSQINWYYKNSQLLEAKHGTINSLMFMHIPLPEWAVMWAAHHDSNRPNANYGITGERNEREYPAAVNSGLFLATFERQDVRGIFVGHEHINDYYGNFHGIYLGYSANIGYATYGLGGDQNDRLRGGRIFELDQNDLTTFETRMVYARDIM